MKATAWIIFPVNLFEDIESIITKKSTPIYVVEDPRYFTDFLYHKLKIAYHIATMTQYANHLKELGYTHVKYIKWQKATSAFYKELKEEFSVVQFIDFGDDTRSAQLHRILGTHMQIAPSPNFTLTRAEITESADLFCNKKKNSTDYQYSFQKFYAFQRKRLNILMSTPETPQGGKWSFDAENRKAFPKNIDPASVPLPYTTRKNTATAPIIADAVERANKEFPKHYGDCTVDAMIYPITFNDATNWLDRFLRDRFALFGTYQDAVHQEIPFGYHAVISPMMNNGLLPDRVVLKKTVAYANKHEIPLASLEGFVRQIIGWRNYVWALYVLDRKQLMQDNQHNAHHKLDERYWLATTGIPPIDDCIKKIIKTGYVHHIERLMYLGTWLLINETDPQETFRIFMEWTIDAYEWVMVPNVTMTSNNSPLMMTRMYINGSNYVLKMSNYKKGAWCAQWDTTYRTFLKKHAKKLMQNYATARQVLNAFKK